MFPNFDPQLLSDPNFKEDAVREVIIVPILTRLGYHPTGSQTVVRSKNLVQPFIYVGTRKHPVTIIPDYTLYFEGRPVLVLDAKSPIESVTSPANVQQAYSYAIHPEVRTDHFALCNGRRLAVYGVEKATPLLDVSFEEFESRWEEIEKHLAPKYLLQPELRKLYPDFGFAVSRLGLAQGAELLMIGTRLSTFARVSQDLYTATVNADFAGSDHCVSFDFKPEQLPLLVAGLPDELRRLFLEALSRSPFQACADLMVEVDLRTHLGESIEVETETFVPLVIDEVFGARFTPLRLADEPTDIPKHIFRLSKAFTIGTPEPPGDA
ncbi:MAG: type I restriction enzyme HsdR N-terminal domain-containing protein [Rhodoferax sp.]|nr:type I restriction enzyme HsdR N-terminal domain-containing protein [Rhodoferax sp.]MDP3650293.1 type I restriction enzyme HsdR N-terminal domain-containing protein [Rhodoferax sp.]